jgi:hypothetical protein
LNLSRGGHGQQPDYASADKNPLRLPCLHLRPPAHVSKFPIKFFVLPTTIFATLGRGTLQKLARLTPCRFLQHPSAKSPVIRRYRFPLSFGGAA